MGLKSGKTVQKFGVESMGAENKEVMEVLTLEPSHVGARCAPAINYSMTVSYYANVVSNGKITTTHHPQIPAGQVRAVFFMGRT